ncbi:unnamed protein product [Ilex paraguariensis]|uniref:Pathogenesis-related homeodomain protein n=1 Tax=Ilex paraguariensis TaxID=185542 RepID=A0ABC8UJI9_9AQUA
MSKAVKIDVPSVQNKSPTGESSSPKKLTSELKDEFGPRSLFDVPVEQKHETDRDMRKGLTEAKTPVSDSISVEQLRLSEDLSKNSSCEPFGALLVDASIKCGLIQMGVVAESVTTESSNPRQILSEPTHELGYECGDNKQLELKEVICIEDIAKGPLRTWTTESELIDVKQVRLSFEDADADQIGPPLGDLAVKSILVQSELSPEIVAMNSSLEHLQPPLDDASKVSGLEQSGPTLEDTNKDTCQLGNGGKETSAQSRKRKNTLRSSVGSARILRSRSKEKSEVPEPSNNVAEDGADREKKRKKRKEQMKEKPVNEFSRIRTHLRYLLHRMKYEQNFIDAYSGEGWKGLSLEKIKPEKELQRAKSEIFRLKLKIRELFQRIDLSCAEGKLPESLFDSDGQIDSEDIFCAKCGFKDVTLANDIILCDGACERGFHQFCLEPPLLKEDIPPDDEGWLCPGCDCKVDCIGLLNDSLGTNLSLTESWEKVFPEAARGNKLDDNFGSLSDDSEDDDYNPDGSEVNEKVESEESSSDGSDFPAASEGLGNPKNDEQLDLSSDDSEDDDFDPNAPDLDEQLKQESSSSDFTSDSEDFSVAFDDSRLSGRDQGPIPSLSNHVSPCTNSNGDRSKLGGMKRRSLSDELAFILESAPAHVSVRRHVERLDYKKLHDEAYGNVSSDSSDEDFTDAAVPKKRRNKTGKIASVSPNGKFPLAKKVRNARDMKYDQNENEKTPKRRNQKKLDLEDTYSSPAKSQKGSSEPGSSGQSITTSPHKRLGEAVTQRLFESFKINQYPERAVKENLANELGLRVQQVSKWFENARWSSRHSLHMESQIAESSRNRGTPPPEINKKPLEPEPNMLAKGAACNGVQTWKEGCSGDGRTGNLVSKKASGQKSVTPKPRKRKCKSEPRASGRNSSIGETPKQNVQDNPPSAQQVKRSDRMQTRSRKSIA